MTYGIPALCQEPPDCFFCCEGPCLPDDPCCAVCRAKIDAEFVSWTLPPDHCVPESARRILDLDKPKLTPAQQQQGENIARAVDRLNSGEHRYGFMVGR